VSVRKLYYFEPVIVHMQDFRNYIGTVDNAIARVRYNGICFVCNSSVANNSKWVITCVSLPTVDSPQSHKWEIQYDYYTGDPLVRLRPKIRTISSLKLGFRFRGSRANINYLGESYLRELDLLLTMTKYSRRLMLMIQRK